MNKAIHLLLPAVLGLGLCLGLAVRAQDDAPPTAGWEYRLLEWGPADVEACVRAATGEEFESLEDLLVGMAEQLEPRHQPALIAATNRRLRDRLNELGVEGWDAFWVRETVQTVSGFVVPAPTVMLKRAR